MRSPQKQLGTWEPSQRLLKTEENKENSCRGGRLQDRPDASPVRQLSDTQVP
jgi:hypothetical protein